MANMFEVLGTGTDKIKVTVEFKGNKDVYECDFITLGMNNVFEEKNMVKTTTLINGSKVNPRTVSEAILKMNAQAIDVIEKIEKTMNDMNL